MKAPDWFKRSEPRSKEEKLARKAIKEADARVAMAEHEKPAEAFANNRERLKAQRLAREAGEGTPPKRD